jgi:hypothetical protein
MQVMMVEVRQFQERLTGFTQDARAAPKKLTSGAQRSDLLQKARETGAAANIDRWPSSPGLRSPK